MWNFFVCFNGALTFEHLQVFNFHEVYSYTLKAKTFNLERGHHRRFLIMLRISWTSPNYLKCHQSKYTLEPIHLSTYVSNPHSLLRNTPSALYASFDGLLLMPYCIVCIQDPQRIRGLHRYHKQTVYMLHK